MNTTDIWLQLQELEQEARDAKGEASRSHSVLQAELDLIKTKVNADFLAQNQRLEALAKRAKTLRGMVGTMVDRERLLASASPEAPTRTAQPSDTSFKDILGGGV